MGDGGTIVGSGVGVGVGDGGIIVGSGVGVGVGDAGTAPSVNRAHVFTGEVRGSSAKWYPPVSTIPPLSHSASVITS